MRETDNVVAEKWNRSSYEIDDLSRVMTPALAVYPDLVKHNIEYTIELLGANRNAWRPHIKTAKLAEIMRMLLAHGVTHFKCSTSLELLTACQAGTRDILLSYPVTGANAVRVLEIGLHFPEVRFSVLVETLSQVETWSGSRFGLFVDINPGMDRTGIEQSNFAKILCLVRAILEAGIEFRGLHYYDGHLRSRDFPGQIIAAHLGYDRLCEIVNGLRKQGITVPEVNTSGTPTLPAALAYQGFKTHSIPHRISSGTIVYGDTTSARQLPSHYRYRPAALVLSRVVSHPRRGIITCDAGHKTLSVDAGVPNCAVVGATGFEPLAPSEEHLPIALPDGAIPPAIGEILYLIPRHVCPTINNFDHALFVSNGKIQSLEPVSSRGRESPILSRFAPETHLRTKG